jgi:hypothetical protein
MSLLLTAHQTGFLPFLGFFHKVALADRYINLDQVQFSTNDWINRNKIKTNQGPIWLTVPILTTGHIGKTISEMEINNRTRWRDKHWKTLYLAYKKAKYFNVYAEFFENLYKREWQYLIDLNEYTFKWLIGILKIKTDLDDEVNYKFKGSKSGLILDMCKELKADTFIFGGQGKSYADLEEFKDHDIKPYFQDYIHPIYNQLHGEFISHMSVIDLLFNEGPRSLEIIMSDNISRQNLREK